MGVNYRDVFHEQESRNVLHSRITKNVTFAQLMTRISSSCNYARAFHTHKPHFYIVKLGFTGVYIIVLFFALKNRLWVLIWAVLTCTHNLCFE